MSDNQITESDIRSISELASDVLGLAMECVTTAEIVLNPNVATSAYPGRLCDNLHELERASWKMVECWSDAIDELFAATQTAPVEIFPPFSWPSVHKAILHEGSKVGFIAADVFIAVNPDCHSEGVEYVCPPLEEKSELLNSIEIVAEATLDNLACAASLNNAQSLREQELSKALRLPSNVITELWENATAVSTGTTGDPPPVKTRSGYKCPKCNGKAVTYNTKSAIRYVRCKVCNHTFTKPRDN